LRNYFLAVKIKLTYFSFHDVHHLLSDGSDLSRLSVGGFLDLVHSSLGESDAEKSKFVSVSGGDVNVSFDFSLPFFDHGALLITGKFHTVKVSQTSVSLDFFAYQTEKFVLKMTLVLFMIFRVRLQKCVNFT
jgi:hypothetical protein